MVAWTGHIGYVGRYGLYLPHELISNPGIVLQCHLSIKKKDYFQIIALHLVLCFMTLDIKERTEKAKNTSCIS